jgi:hypothetical protein
VRLERFEDLVADPATETAAICEWLGIEYSAAMLDVPQWGSSNIQAGKAVGVSSEMIAKWKEVLTTGELEISERKTARLMAEYGYKPCGRGGISVSTVLQLLIRYPVHVVGALLSNPRRVLIQLKAVLRASTGSAT